ncbi:hypothetical protein HDU67_002302, partial [Dinochytrium kinnereticum]
MSTSSSDPMSGLLRTTGVFGETGNKDWVNFSIVMEAFLDASELWYIVESGPDPIKYDANGVAEARTASQQKADKDDKKARVILLSKLSRANLQLVFNKKSAKGVWDALKAIYATAAINNAVYLRDLLAEIHYDGGSVPEHISKINGVIFEIRQNGGTFSDEEHISVLLRSFPNDLDWKPVKTMIS